jgi:hypothetical protein
MQALRGVYQAVRFYCQWAGKVPLHGVWAVLWGVLASVVMELSASSYLLARAQNPQ